MENKGVGNMLITKGVLIFDSRLNGKPKNLVEKGHILKALE